MEVPVSLKRLVRMVMRGFYGLEHVLVIDMLIRKPCVKEEELETLLKFERKQLRSIIAQLKNDKMLKTKLRMETGPDGKASRQNYYYINYKAFVNVVKYKLDHMRRKIETEERDSTSRASFLCMQCKKTFTDLEADQLCDLTTGEFRCSFCGATVEEDPNVLPKADSRLVLAKFNEQIEPLYILLKQVEDIILPSDLLEPEPVETSANVKAEGSNSTFTINGQNGFTDNWRESDRNRGINSEFDSMLFSDSSLTVKIEQVDEGLGINKNVKREEESGVRVKKEAVPWLKESTISSSSLAAISSTPSLSKRQLFEKENTSSNFSAPGTEDSVGSSKEIMEALLHHEKQQEASSSALSFLQNHSDVFPLDETNDGSATGSKAEEVMESDEEEMEEVHSPKVRIGPLEVPLNDVNDDHIQKMTPSEKEEYIRLTQEVYSHMYE